MDAFGEVMDMVNSFGPNMILVRAPITTRLFDSRLNNSEVDSLLNTFGTYYNFID